MELIRELCSFEGRGPGTDAERRAANMLAGRLRADRAARPRSSPSSPIPQYALVHLVHAAIGGRRQHPRDRPAGGRLRPRPLRRHLDLPRPQHPPLPGPLPASSAAPPRTSSLPATAPSAPARLILIAHYDAARTGYIFSKASKRIRKLPERARIALGPFRLFFWLGLAPLLPILGARMAGLDADLAQCPPGGPHHRADRRRLPPDRHRPLGDRPRRLRQRLGRGRRALGRGAS